MNLDELRLLVAAGESERLEFKTSTGSRHDAMQTVCAMLNGSFGGFVIFGVNDRGQIVGQQLSTRTKVDLATELVKFEPPAFPDIEYVPLDQDRVVIVMRISGSTGLYTYDVRAYYRNGPTTHRMSRSFFEQQLLERNHAVSRWENCPAPENSIADLDADQIMLTIEEAIRRQRLEDPGTRDLERLLTGLGLMENGILLRAALVLFGRPERLQSRYPRCILRMARFRGIDKTESLDNR